MNKYITYILIEEISLNVMVTDKLRGKKAVTNKLLIANFVYINISKI